MLLEPTAIRELELHLPVALTLADRRLYNYLLFNAIDHIQERLEFTLELEKLHGIFAMGGPSQDRLQESLRRLLNVEIEFLAQEKNQLTWHITTLLADATLNITQSRLVYSYSTKCRMLFTHSLLLERCLIQAHFTCKYSTLIYELLAEEFYKGQIDFYMEIEALRGRLRVEPNKMSNFSDFKRFALEPALKEINTYAGFTAQYKPVNRGRKIIGLNFSCKAKSAVDIHSPKNVIPPKRPRLFVESPEEDYAYAYLLNANTAMRRHFFEMSQKRLGPEHKLDSHDIDKPDSWYRLVLTDLMALKV